VRRFTTDCASWLFVEVAYMRERARQVVPFALCQLVRLSGAVCSLQSFVHGSDQVVVVMP
jgi:hypothetical protein